MKSYVVIGLYADNQQIWAHPARANTPVEAAETAAKEMLKSNRWDEDRLENILIVEVLEGRPKLTLGNQTPVPADRLRDEEE